MSTKSGEGHSGNSRARRTALELARLWLRRQSDSAVARSFHERVGAGKGSGQAVVRSKQLESRPDMKLCGQAPSRGEQRAVNDVDRKRLI